MSLIDLLFPKNCLECAKQGGYVCSICLKKVPKGSIKYYKIGDFKAVFGIWGYEGVVRKAIIKLKYNFAYEIALELAGLAAAEIKGNKLLNKNLVLVPIPLHNRRENWRGFNQASVLGKGISSGLGWSFEQNLLTSRLASKQQVGLSKSERLQNKRGKYEVNLPHGALAKWGDKSIMLFDDVWTTGATMREAAKTLKNAGFGNIYGLTICA